MARYINKPRKTLLRIKLGNLSYRRLVATADSAVTALTGNANYPTPSPLLATITAAATALQAACSSLGNKRNRTSKANVADCREKALALKSLLTSLNQYLQNTATENEPTDTIAQRSQLATTGIGLKLQPIKSGKPVAIVRNLHQANNKVFPFSLHRIAWKRPIGLIKGRRVDSYIITNAATGATLGQTIPTNFIVAVAPMTKVTVVVTPVAALSKGIPAQITVS